MSELFSAIGPRLSLLTTFGAPSRPIRSNVKHAPRDLRLFAALLVWAAVWLLISTVWSVHSHAVATRSDSVLCKRH